MQLKETPMGSPTPKTIAGLWTEYIAPRRNGKSIQNLETTEGLKWRTASRRFSKIINRRKKIWDAIVDSERVSLRALYFQVGVVHGGTQQDYYGFNNLSIHP